MLGSDLVRYLSPHFSVTSITKENYLRFVNRSFDLLINANGNSKRFWAEKNVLDDFDASTKSVYKTILDFKCKMYIYISSSDVYQDHTNIYSTKESINEEVYHLSPYGFHKNLSESIVKNYCKKYLIIRCSMMLGKNLIKGPIFDIENNKELFISKSSSLQMITTQEIAEIIEVLYKKKVKNEVYNAGGKGVVNFKNIQKFFSNKVQFKENSKKQIYEMNVEKLNKLFPLKTSVEYLQEYLATL